MSVDLFSIFHFQFTLVRPLEMEFMFLSTTIFRVLIKIQTNVSSPITLWFLCPAWAHTVDNCSCFLGGEGRGWKTSQFKEGHSLHWAVHTICVMKIWLTWLYILKCRTLIFRRDVAMAMPTMQFPLCKTNKSARTILRADCTFWVYSGNFMLERWKACYAHSSSTVLHVLCKKEKLLYIALIMALVHANNTLNCIVKRKIPSKCSSGLKIHKCIAYLTK